MIVKQLLIGVDENKNRRVMYFLIPHKQEEAHLKLFKYKEEEKDWRLMRTYLPHDRFVGKETLHGLERISRLSLLVLTGWSIEELEAIGRSLSKGEIKTIRKPDAV